MQDESGGYLHPAGAAVLWDLTGAPGGARIGNAGRIVAESGRAIDTDGSATQAQSLTLANGNGAEITANDEVLRVGTSLNGGSIDIDNAGTMRSLNGRAINVQEYAGLASFHLNNQTNGYLRSVGDTIRLTSATDGQPFNGTVNITNAGQIVSLGSGTASGQAIDLNDLNPAGQGHVSITNLAGGQIIAVDADAIRTGANATINNYGEIRAGSSATNDAINVEDNAGVVVWNYQSGEIWGVRNGISGNRAVVIHNEGLIQGRLGSGIHIEAASGATTTIVNEAHGLISSYGPDAPEGDGIHVDGLLDLTNRGQISGIHNAISGNASGTIYNDGLIQGRLGSAIILDTAPTSVTKIVNDVHGVIDTYGGTTHKDGIHVSGLVELTNRGKITTAGPSHASWGNAVMIGGGTIVNTGTMASNQVVIRVGGDLDGSGHGGLNLRNQGLITSNSSFDAIAIRSVGNFSDTIENFGTIVGGIAAGGGDDVIHGGNIRGLIYGEDGNDTIDQGYAYGVFGGAGNDTISGSGSLYGEDGDDHIFVGYGLAYGGAGDDTFEISPNTNYVSGGDGYDTVVYRGPGDRPIIFQDPGQTGYRFDGESIEAVRVIGTQFNDVIYGDGRDNQLFGGEGDDTLRGGGGNNVLNGGAGNDHYLVERVTDTILDESGNDFVSAAVNYTISAGIETVAMVVSGLTVTGNEEANTVGGSGGSDTIYGAGGDDYLYGNAGDDLIDGGWGYNTLSGGDGNDVLRGGAHDDTLYGGAGDDHLFGGRGSDHLGGNAGADILEGGDGNDFYFIEDALDTVVETAEGGVDIVTTMIDYTLADNLEFLVVGIDTGLVGVGSRFDNYLLGGRGNDILNGMAGNDELAGGGGADVLTGGAGKDIFHFHYVSDSGYTTGLDHVADFSAGEGDAFDLYGIRYTGPGSADTSFTWLGTGAFTGAGGELHYRSVDGGVMVEGDVTGDGAANFAFMADNVTSLSQSDFLL
jgi:Ca2+-binding RTX toxin-like protein